MASDILLITCRLEQQVGPAGSIERWIIDEAEAEPAVESANSLPRKCPLPSTTEILNQALNNAVLG